MILVLGTVRLAPENLAIAMPAIEKMVAASRAEDGCVAFASPCDVPEGWVYFVDLEQCASGLPSCQDDGQCADGETCDLRSCALDAVGARGVCEPAAILAAGGGPLLITKKKNGNVTVAVAEKID